MMNHDSSHSEYFEELCALAASGQISERKFEDSRITSNTVLTAGWCTPILPIFFIASCRLQARSLRVLPSGRFLF